MSLSLNTLVKAVKIAATDAIYAQKPMSMVLGKVAASNPLKISVDQKLTLTQEQLLLTDAVCDYEVEMTVDHNTDYSAGGSGDDAFASHCHKYSGIKKYTVHNGLKLGESVVLLRCDGGQRFIVLDRLRVPK